MTKNSLEGGGGWRKPIETNAMRLPERCSIASYHYNMTNYRLWCVMKRPNMFLVNEVKNIMI